MHLLLSALRAFDAAARKGRFRGAADALGITPTAISYHIRGFEDQLGIKLFDHSARNAADGHGQCLVAHVAKSGAYCGRSDIYGAVADAADQ